MSETEYAALTAPPERSRLIEFTYRRLYGFYSASQGTRAAADGRMDGGSAAGIDKTSEHKGAARARVRVDVPAIGTGPSSPPDASDTTSKRGSTEKERDSAVHTSRMGQRK